MANSLRNIRQAEAIRAFVRLGGVERQGKGSHRVVEGEARMVTVKHDGATIRMDMRTLIPLVHEAEEGGYWAEIPEIPGCVSQGETIPELFTNLVEAFEAVQAAESSTVVVTSTISPDTTVRMRPNEHPQTTTGTA